MNCFNWVILKIFMQSLRTCLFWSPWQILCLSLQAVFCYWVTSNLFSLAYGLGKFSSFLDLFSLLIFCVIFEDQRRTWLLTLFSFDAHFNHLRYLILYLYISGESSWGKKILACSRGACGTSNYWSKIFFLRSVFSTQTTLKRQKGTYPITACWTAKALAA